MSPGDTSLCEDDRSTVLGVERLAVFGVPMRIIPLRPRKHDSIVGQGEIENQIGQKPLAAGIAPLHADSVARYGNLVQLAGGLAAHDINSRIISGEAGDDHVRALHPYLRPPAAEVTLRRCR